MQLNSGRTNLDEAFEGWEIRFGKVLLTGFSPGKVSEFMRPATLVFCGNGGDMFV